MTRVRVETPVHATESLAKVKLACLQLFPDLRFVEEGDRLVGEGESVDTLRDLVRNQKIRDTVRDALIRNIRGRTTSLGLSKQAAYVGRVNLAVDSPLGDLRVTLEDEDLDAVIDRIAESTVGHRLTSSGRNAGT